MTSLASQNATGAEKSAADYNYKRSLGWSLVGAFAGAALCTVVLADTVLSGGLGTTIVSLAGAGMARTIYGLTKDSKLETENELCKTGIAAGAVTGVVAINPAMYSPIVSAIGGALYFGPVFAMAAVGAYGLAKDTFKVWQGWGKGKTPQAPALQA